MEEIKLTSEQKDRMLKWVQEAADAPRPWWQHCSEPDVALAFVREHLPHLLDK